MGEQLKSCPFCGSEAERLYEDDNFFGCRPCGVYGPEGNDASRGLTEWNTRPAPASPPGLPEQIGRLTLGERLSQEHYCGGGHEMADGEPVYWEERGGEYPDDIDGYCVSCAIERAISENNWCVCSPISLSPDARVLPIEGEAESKFWLSLREPGKVPDRKGPWPITQTAKVLREFIEARPTAYIDYITLGSMGEPHIQHGPEVLQMADGRSMATGRKHNARVRAAEAALKVSHPLQGEGE